MHCAFTSYSRRGRASMGWKSRGKKIYVCMNGWMNVAFSLAKEMKRKKSLNLDRYAMIPVGI